MKVFITKELPGNPEKMLRKNGFKVTIHKGNRPVSRRELIKESADADALICLLTDKIDREIIAGLKKCRVIANVAVGFNNIDIGAATEKNIIVTNTPDILTDATADLTMALLLAAARRIPEGERMMRANAFKGWKPDLLLGVELKNKILGIAGAGRIGSSVAQRAKAFGMKIIYTDHKQNPVIDIEEGAEMVPLNTLLKKSDIISFHLPLNQTTRHILNCANIKHLKRNAIIINTSRGEIIEEECLIKALKEKKILAAGLDVYENEPEINKEFLKLENVVLLPHIGSATRETRANMASLAAVNVLNILKGKEAQTPVNRINN